MSWEQEWVTVKSEIAKLKNCSLKEPPSAVFSPIETADVTGIKYSELTGVG